MRALVALLLCAWTCLAQQPAEFRTEVRLINVSFTARDSRGGLVTDLTRDDVEVLDDGVLQTISFFARSDELPLALGLLADASGSQESFIKRHKRDVREFLKNVLRPSDRAFLVCFGNRLRLVSDFSSSANVLIDGFEKFDGGNRSMPELGPRGEQRILGTAFYDAIYYAAEEKLAGAELARRALVVFSDGEDNSSARHMLDAIEAPQTANIPIYGIRYTETRRGRMNARNKYGVAVMQRIARETGGADFDAEKTDLRETFRASGEELRSSYELAYHPTHKTMDGSFRKLMVRSKRPGVVIRAKTGYYARE
jgi:Ca-activated chloride channel homolog